MSVHHRKQYYLNHILVRLIISREYNIKKFIFLTILIIMICCSVLTAAETKPRLARLNYDGGGDWYNDPDLIPNLTAYANKQIGTDFSTEQAVVKASDGNISDYPFVFMTGHGNILFTEKEVASLRKYLLLGGFLYVDDDYGMDKSFRREVRKLFPEKQLIELPGNHELYNCFFNFPNGLPKIHKHDDKRPQAFGIFDDQGRLMILYTFESNISDGWANPEVHKDPPEVREQALKFGTNILYYLMTKTK